MTMKSILEKDDVGLAMVRAALPHVLRIDRGVVDSEKFDEKDRRFSTALQFDRHPESDPELDLA